MASHHRARVHFDARQDVDDDDVDYSDELDESKIATLPLRVAESIRMQDHKLHENRTELMRLLRRSEERNLLANAKFQGAVDSLSEELAAAHTTISMLKHERDKLRTKLSEALHQIDIWENRAAQERDRATASLNCAEVERDRVAGLESLLAESHRRERQLAADLASTIASSQRVALERDEALRKAEKSDREVSLSTKALADARERVAEAEETAETLRQDRRASASVLELNNTLTRHVAIAVKANQALAESLLRFDGLRDCVRPVPSSAVAGLYEFDGDKWARRCELEALRLESNPKQWSDKQRETRRRADDPENQDAHRAVSVAFRDKPAKVPPRAALSSSAEVVTSTEDERRVSDVGSHPPLHPTKRRSTSSGSPRTARHDRDDELVTTVKVTHHEGCTNHLCRSSSKHRSKRSGAADGGVAHAPTLHVEGPICDGCRAALARGDMPDKNKQAKPTAAAVAAPTAAPGKTKFRVCIHTPDKRTIVY